MGVSDGFQGECAVAIDRWTLFEADNSLHGLQFVAAPAMSNGASLVSGVAASLSN